MASNLKNLTDKISKLSIDQVYDTNWCDMPDDIKLECIGKMKWKERLSLRCTAKAERSLVDSQKIEFNRGAFWRDTFWLHRHNDEFFWKKTTDINKRSELMNYIKKVGVFENLYISSGDVTCDWTGDGLLTAKKVEFNFSGTENKIALLRKLKNGVESIKMDGDTTTFDKLVEILEIPQIQNVPYWHIYSYRGTNSLHKVAQMWIAKNTKIGSTFQTTVDIDGSFDEFLEHFIDRIVWKSEKRVRIGTNNSDRHILLERGLDDVLTIDFHVQFFRLMVISAEMKESDYDDNCEEWICRIVPYFYDE